MAWATKKQYAILMSSEEGKDLAENLGEMSQDDFNKKFSELLGKNGQTIDKKPDNEEEKQKWLDENGYENEDEVPWWEKDGNSDEDDDDYIEEEENRYLNKTWDNSFKNDKKWVKNDQGFYDYELDYDNYGYVQYGAKEDNKINAGYVLNGEHDKPIEKLFENPQEAKEFIETNLIKNNKPQKRRDYFGLFGENLLDEMNYDNQTDEEVVFEAIGLAKQEVDLDDFVYALNEKVKNKNKRKIALKAFIEQQSGLW